MRGGRGAGGRAGGAAAQRWPQARRRSAEQPDDDDAEVVVAGLVGGGGGGLTPLVFAAREGDIESAKLLDRGEGRRQPDDREYGWTPLLVAVNNRNYQLAKLLLDSGANANLANKGGWTPLYLATDNRNIEGGDYPVPKAGHGSPRADQAAARQGCRSERQGQGQHADAHDLHDAVVLRERRDGVHPRRAVERHGADEAAARLQGGPEGGDRAGRQRADGVGGIGWVDGVTYERSAKENLEAVRMLLDLGLDPNSANQEGRTPLMGAALKGRTEVIQLLVDRGASSMRAIAAAATRTSRARRLPA